MAGPLYRLSFSFGGWGVLGGVKRSVVNRNKVGVLFWGDPIEGGGRELPRSIWVEKRNE